MEKKPDHKTPTDMDWMLQSSQVSDADLIHVLTKEMYLGLYQLAYALILDSNGAEEAAREVIIWSVLNRHRYWGEIRLRSWLYRQAYRVSRGIHRKRKLSRWVTIDRFLKRRKEETNGVLWPPVFDRLEEKYRLVAVLRFLQEIPPADIAQVLDENIQSIHFKINHVRDQIPEILGADRPFSNPLAPPHKSFISKWLLARDDLLSEAELGELDQHLRTCSQCHETAAWFEKSESQFKLALQASWTGMEEDRSRNPELYNHIAVQVKERWRQRGASISTKETIFGGLAVLLVILAGWATGFFSFDTSSKSTNLSGSSTPFNRLTPFTPPPAMVGVFLIKTGFPADVLLQPTPVTPVPYGEPLTAGSGIEAIRRKVQESKRLWSTLWAEAEVIDYGPLGYIGPPQFYRNRLWITQPDRMLVLAGPPNSNPNYIRIAIANNYYEMNLSNGVANYPYSTDLQESSQASKLLLSFSFSYADRNRLFGFYLAEPLLQPDTLLTEGDLQLREEVTISGRRALILDHNISGHLVDRIWVDCLTGLLLRWQTFYSEDPGVIRRDVRITSLALNINFPKGFYAFVPEKSKLSWNDLQIPAKFLTLSWDTTGVRSLATSYPKPPQGYDPSHAQLLFDWSSSDPGFTSPGSVASLVAGGYLLGKVDMGDPLSLICKRSMDGNIIVFIDRPDIPFYAALKMRWFRLTDVSKVYNPFPQGYVSSDVAISHNSRYLAFYGCSQAENCGVIVYDTQSLQTRKLIDLTIAGYFQWSPDDQFLAMIGASDLSNMRTLVVRSDTGEVVYRGPFDWKTMSASEDSPTQNWGWGIHFPEVTTGLEGCVYPPKN